MSVASLRAYGLGEDLLDEIAQVAHHRADLRARGRDPAHARRRQQERHRGAHPGDGAARLRPRLAPAQALLHDRAADRGPTRTSAASSQPASACSRSGASGSARWPRSRSRSARTCPSRTRRSVGAHGSRGRDRATSRASCARAREPGSSFKHHHSGISWVEGILARGDRRLADVIEDAWRAGARFDGWDEVMDTDRVADALAARGVDVAAYLGTLPVERAAAVGPHRRRARGRLPARRVPQGAQGRASPPCGKSPAGAPPHQRRRRRGRRQAAGLLRLRRRLRPVEDARRPDRRAARAGRARAAARGPAPGAGAADQQPARAGAEGRLQGRRQAVPALAPPVHQAGPDRVPRPPRPDAAAGPVPAPGRPAARGQPRVLAQAAHDLRAGARRSACPASASSSTSTSSTRPAR